MKTYARIEEKIYESTLSKDSFLHGDAAVRRRGNIVCYQCGFLPFTHSLSVIFQPKEKKTKRERERDWKGWSWLSSSSSSLFINLSIFLFFSPPLLLFSLSPYSLDFSSVRSFRAQRSLVDRGATLSPSSMVALVERESRRRVEGGKKGNKKTQGIRRRGLVCLS